MAERHGVTVSNVERSLEQAERENVPEQRLTRQE